MIHRLKTAQPYYDAVVSGMKTFDIRIADRDYQVGDRLVLQEYVDDELTGREEHRVITYVMSDPQYVLPGSVVLGIRDPQEPHWHQVARELREALLEVQAVQQELNDSGNPFLQVAAGKLNGIKAHLWTPEELAALESDRG